MIGWYVAAALLVVAFFGVGVWMQRRAERLYWTVDEDINSLLEEPERIPKPKHLTVADLNQHVRELEEYRDMAQAEMRQRHQLEGRE